MAVESNKTTLDAILDVAVSREPQPLAGAKKRNEKLQALHAYGTRKAHERGLGLDDVTPTVKARVKNPNK